MGDFNPAPNPPPLVIHPSWYALTPSQNAALQRAKAAPVPIALASTPPAPPKEDFLIIGLFALRLTRKLIRTLDYYYSSQVADLNWLGEFLSHYDAAYDLAKIKGGLKAQYLERYPEVLKSMRRQNGYPQQFMAMNPTVPPRRRALHRQGGLTDADRKEIVDFVDAATEWGSTVLIPRSEAESILKMAEQRLIADLEAGRGGVDCRERSREHSVVAHGSPQRDSSFLAPGDYFPGAP